ncbi:LysM peptidoglycan-binding domain-containing protein [Gleimia europaea]|uniref:LysM peptidoglycan-binding domain-containing protein n=1 Tax=Gleimia europaea TaxID=66228 RepID=UPI00278A17FB|nr:LysM domain-containing protein [Gleimia europaea]MDP9834822.1 LysM repeat protein [Gleimia europaea]
MESNRNSKSSASIALASAAAFTVSAAASLSIAIDNSSALGLLQTDANAILHSSLNPNALALPLITAFLGFTIATLSLWSLTSLLVTEILLILARRGTPVQRLLELAVNTSSPLVRSLLKKRVATLAVSASFVVSVTSAFAPAPATVQDNLGWQAVSAQETRPSQTSVPSDLTLSDPSDIATPTPQASSPTPKAQDSASHSENLATSHAHLAKESSSSQATDVPPQTNGNENASGGKSEQNATSSGKYVVRSGDSLWTIAARHLQSSDSTKIAAEWHRIYNLNKSAIGTNPDLIYPGTTLTLPEEDL